MLKVTAGFLGLLLIILSGVVFKNFPSSLQVEYGVTFSPTYAKYLKLDWQGTYLQILDDLKVKNLRLSTYWNVLEPQPEKYDFSQTDYLLEVASKKAAKVILVIGARQPRWPECHAPAWAKSLTIGERQQKTLRLIGKVVKRYKDNDSIWAWQVENEPFAFWFGQDCDPPDEKFLQEEIKLVKDLDNTRPVIVTDSGEWSDWKSAMKDSDILGVSLYRKSYNTLLRQYISYPFPFWMYSLKSGLVRKLFASSNQKTIISELQTEPWFKESVLETAIDEQSKQLSLKQFKDNIEYAKKTGFDQNYLWGVEWWYYMAQQGHPEYLEYARTLFK